MSIARGHEMLRRDDDGGGTESETLVGGILGAQSSQGSVLARRHEERAGRHLRWRVKKKFRCGKGNSRVDSRALRNIGEQMQGDGLT